MKKPISLFFLILLPCGSFLNAQWTQVGSDIDGEAAEDLSGGSVALSSNGIRLAIGANKNDGNGSSSGHVRIYEESSGGWMQVGSDIDGEAAGDASGISVSLSSNGTRVAIGAIGNDDNGTTSGHVRVYEEIGGNWIQIGSDIDGEAAFDYFGWSVSLSSNGTRVAIGAYLNDGNGTFGSNSGHVRVYEESGGNWVQVGNDIDGEAAFDQSGRSVSLSSSGTRVAIGAPENYGTGSNSGHVRVYEENSGIWTQVGSDIDGEAAFDFSGFSVSLSSDGTRLAIGAPGDHPNGFLTNYVRVYEKSGGSWSQVGSDIDGETAGDGFGWSVSLSFDGTRVAIGAPANENNGYWSGHVRVYEENEGNWFQVGSDIDGEAVLDQSGFSVSLSSAGTRLAIGAYSNDGNGVNSGHVRIYDDSTLTDLIPIPLEEEKGFNIESVFTDQKNLSMTFNLPANKKIITTLFDLNGRVVLNEKHFFGKGLNTLNLDIGSLPPGVYVVHLWDGQRGVSERFVKP